VTRLLPQFLYHRRRRRLVRYGAVVWMSTARQSYLLSSCCSSRKVSSGILLSLTGFCRHRHGSQRHLIASLPILLGHTLATLTVTIPGFSLALIGGFSLGIALDASPLLRRAIYPLLVTSQTVPIVAIAPLLVVGFGFGLLPKVIVVALVTFFPIVVNTIDGLQNADRDQRRLLEAMGANYWQLLRLLRLRAALPAMFTGIKVAITYSVIGAVLAEWIGASTGLGVYIARSLRAFRTDQVFVAALVTSLLTIVLFTLVSLLERKIVFWKGEH